MSDDTRQLPSDELLYTITGVFRVKGRGMCILGVVDSRRFRLHIGDHVEVRDGDRVLLATRAADVEQAMVAPQQPPDGGDVIGVLISMDPVPQIAEGRTLWKVRGPDGGGTQ